MKLVKVGAATINTTPLDWDANYAAILEAIAMARDEGVSVLCLPELCITGYGCEDTFHSPAVQATALELMGEILPHTKDLIVSLGLPLLHRNALYNTACLVCDREPVGFVAKQFLAGEGIHYEPRWFKPWPAGEITTVTALGHDTQLGDLYFDCGDVRIGFEICHDAWVATRPGCHLSSRAVDIILNPSASHFAFAKIDVRKRLVLEGSRAFGVTYVYANLVGNEAGRAIYDGGAFIASNGQLVASGRRFSFANVEVTSAVVDITASRTQRSRSSSFNPNVDTEDSCVRCAFSYPAAQPHKSTATEAVWESSPQRKEEEFTRAVGLGLFDYMRKSHSRGFVISLSGGSDSSAAAVLVRQMVALGVAELGPEGFAAKLGLAQETAKAASHERMVAELLTCAYQSTEHSSQTTRHAAQQVAQAIGASFIEFDVNQICVDYVAMVSNAIGRSIDWERDDIALQNIQARVRAPSVWMLANLRRALLLCTSNRSEAAVGYATMDGDTAGGLAPLGGIDKAFLRQWLRWMERCGPQGLAPIPALKYVNAQEPTAELQPPSQGQTDERDLMPYELLDVIERATIRDKLGPADVFALMRATFPQYESEQMLTWVERFFRLWCANQWKRERYAPSFHLDDENLDPKTWCRFPILSGGYQRELRHLRAQVCKNELDFT